MTTNDLIVSVSGIRGIVGAGLTPEPALRFAQALATATQGGTFVLSRDGRPSGAVLRHAALAGLLGCGATVHDLGVTPTPTVGLTVRQLGAAGGIQITASHNPAPWNGLKLFGPDGAVLTAAQGQQIKTIFDGGQFRQAAWDHIGDVIENRRAETGHRERVLELVDVTRIRSRQVRVFLDANGGAGGPLGKALLESLGCRTEVVGGNADGYFEHEPEPVEANLHQVCLRVASSGAALGFVLDPDADRLAIIDENGHYIGEELTLALAVQYRLRAERGPVVINMSTSRLVEDIAGRCGVPCHRSAVGEANVVEKMREVGAVIGGEGNGGVIDPRVGWVRDPFIGMGLILNLLAEEGKPLSAVVAGLPRYDIVKDKCTVQRERLPQAFEQLKQRWQGVKSNTVDGLRLDWADRWVHVRPSNTEPIVRIIAEAPAASQARELIAAVRGILPSEG
jgi:phosphomannomutase